MVARSQARLGARRNGALMQASLPKPHVVRSCEIRRGDAIRSAPQHAAIWTALTRLFILVQAAFDAQAALQAAATAGVPQHCALRQIARCD